MIDKKPSGKPLPPRQDGTSEPPLRLATVREACTYGRFSHTKAYDYINAGLIDAYRRGPRTLIDLDSIDRMHATVLTKIEPKGEAAK